MNSGAISQPKASTSTSQGALPRRRMFMPSGSSQGSTVTPSQPCGAIQLKAQASSTHSRTR